MTELERFKWQIYFSHLSERTNRTIHVMVKKRKVVKQRIRVKDDQFEANINKSRKEWGEGNVGEYVWKMKAETQHAINATAEQCGVDDCEGELEDNSKATINVNDHKCNVIEDTWDDIGNVLSWKVMK